MDKNIRYEETTYGFIYGAAEVTRLVSYKGSVVLMIRTPRQEMQIRITPTGLIRSMGVHKVANKEIEL